MPLNHIGSRLKAACDKVIVLIVLVALIASLSYLGWHMGMMRSMQQRFIADIDRIRPEHEKAAQAEVSAYRRAVMKVQAPSQLDRRAWTNSVFVPPSRVWCADCRRPIPFAATVCPFCRAPQPLDPGDDPDRDLDFDGMKDVWELQYGLNPRDPADAGGDRDADGFTNLEEFISGTDPTDAEDAPEIAAKLCVTRVTANPFKLRFKSVSRMPDGTLMFQINTRGNERTYFKKLGEEAEGFDLHAYEAKEERWEEANGSRKRVDDSVLTLRRGDRLIHLIKDRFVQYDEYTAHLCLTVDGTRYALKVGDTLELKGKVYELIGIDSRSERVVLRRVKDGREMTVRKCAAAGERSAGASAGHRLSGY